jgi:hypothetical protein
MTQLSVPVPTPTGEASGAIKRTCVIAAGRHRDEAALTNHRHRYDLIFIGPVTQLPELVVTPTHHATGFGDSAGVAEPGVDVRHGRVRRNLLRPRGLSVFGSDTQLTAGV